MAKEPIESLIAESDKLTWNDVRKECIKTKEQFLEQFPSFTAWVAEAERFCGNFEGVSSFSFDDGRCMFLIRFEKVYSISFHNPQNNEAEQNTEFNLSYESLFAFDALYQLHKSDVDRFRFWQALGYSDDETQRIMEDENKNVNNT